VNEKLLLGKVYHTIRTVGHPEKKQKINQQKLSSMGDYFHTKWFLKRGSISDMQKEAA
jgi:hypothetical protein